MIGPLPRIQFKERGVLVTQIAREPYGKGFNRRDVQKALESCVMTPDDCDRLLFGFNSLPFVHEGDRFTRGSRRRRVEHVITREANLTQRSLPIFQVDYYKAAAHPDQPVDHVWTDMTEIIYGLGGKGILGIIPTRMLGDRITPITQRAMDIVIKWGTLVVLPPNIQVNYWKDFGESYKKGGPGFRALYFTSPITYKEAVSRKLD